MNTRHAAAAAALAVSLLGAGGAAGAQEPAPPAPGGERPAEDARDRVRLRGGFSLNGGVLLLPHNPAGGAFSVAGRVGVQFNHYVALYYQNTPLVGATASREMMSGALVFADYNSVVVNLTLLHMIELGVGPSLDYVALARGSLMGLTPSAETGTGLAAGGHGRVAINIGGLSGKGPRRSGFSIGVDAHPMFLSIGKTLSLTTGLGAEWF